VGTIAFLRNHRSAMQEYSKYRSELTRQQKETAESNFTAFAVKTWTFVLRPRPNGFISDCKEKYFPDRFRYSAYNVFGFEVGQGAVNPFLSSFQELNWSFIAALILSFATLLFTFDTISGERQSKTLAQVFSNPIRRATVLWGKYVSALLTTMLMAIVGVILSTLIVLSSKTVDLSLSMFAEILGFLLLVFLVISCVAAFGILASVLAHQPNVSLLIALVFWLFFVVVIPNSAVFWANKVFSIEHVDAVKEKIGQAHGEIERNAPKGHWNSAYGTPFLAEHELRADHQMKRMNSEMRFKNAYYRDMFRQLEHTRLLTSASPVALFDYMNEAVVGGGYIRFRRVWDDLHEYQARFLEFFKIFDAKDPNSPHWYNPYEDLSTTRKPVAFEQVPLFKEKPLSLAERFSFLRNYLVVIIVYIAGVFSLTYVIFLRYDVR
jgi:ABC-type transport system involved in multi-copper enzyme maturation permease subunit